jgi:hypothetical protein
MKTISGPPSPAEVEPLAPAVSRPPSPEAEPVLPVFPTLGAVAAYLDRRRGPPAPTVTGPLSPAVSTPMSPTVSGPSSPPATRPLTAPSSPAAGPSVPAPSVSMATSSAPTSPSTGAPSPTAGPLVDYLKVTRPITRVEIAAAVQTAQFKFQVHQGRVRLLYSRDTRVKPDLALLAVPQADVLPFKLRPGERDFTTIPWWDPRISESLVRINQFGHSRQEADWRRATQLNRRNLHRKGRPGYDSYVQHYLRPREVYRSHHTAQIARQQARMKKKGQAVLDRQSPYTSSTSGSDGDGGRRSPTAGRRPTAGPGVTAGPSGTAGPRRTARSPPATRSRAKRLARPPGAVATSLPASPPTVAATAAPAVAATAAPTPPPTAVPAVAPSVVATSPPTAATTGQTVAVTTAEVRPRGPLAVAIRNRPRVAFRDDGAHVLPGPSGPPSPGAVVPPISVSTEMRTRFSLLSAALWRQYLRQTEGDSIALSWFTPEEHRALDAFLWRRYGL